MRFEVSVLNSNFKENIEIETIDDLINFIKPLSGKAIIIASETPKIIIL